MSGGETPARRAARRAARAGRRLAELLRAPSLHLHLHIDATLEPDDDDPTPGEAPRGLTSCPWCGAVVLPVAVDEPEDGDPAVVELERAHAVYLLLPGPAASRITDGRLWVPHTCPHVADRLAGYRRP